MHVFLASVPSNQKYAYSPTEAHFGSWKKTLYEKIVLVGLYLPYSREY